MNLLTKSQWLEDWYILEGSPFGIPEGTSMEWREVIEACKEKRNCEAGLRVGVVFDEDHAEALFYSPRNRASDDDFAAVSYGKLPEWITIAEAVLDYWKDDAD